MPISNPLPTPGLAAQAFTAACLAAMAICLIPSAHAQTSWFQIEVIIFDEPGGAGAKDEHWPSDPGVPSLDGAIELNDGDSLGIGGNDARPHAFRQLARSRLSLRGVWSRLERSGQFRPLAHLAWQQPGRGPRSARPVHVVAWGESTGNVTGGGQTPIVDGTLRVYRARFLHTEVDLVYRPHGSGPIISAVPAGATNAPGTPLDPRYRLTISRKMRSRELHYIDHPLFGVIIQALPVTAASAARESAADTAMVWPTTTASP